MRYRYHIGCPSDDTKSHVSLQYNRAVVFSEREIIRDYHTKVFVRGR